MFRCSYLYVSKNLVALSLARVLFFIEIFVHRMTFKLYYNVFSCSYRNVDSSDFRKNKKWNLINLERGKKENPMVFISFFSIKFFFGKNIVKTCAKPIGFYYEILFLFRFRCQNLVVLRPNSVRFQCSTFWTIRMSISKNTKIWLLKVVDAINI